MDVLNNAIGDLIRASRDHQSAIAQLEQCLALLITPTLTDHTLLPVIYGEVQRHTRGEHIQDTRMCFVFIVAYLYSPASIFGDAPLKSGLRSRLVSIIGQCKSEVSKLLSAGKLQYEKVQSFHSKIETIRTAISAILPDNETF